MLYNIPPVIPPKLMKILMEMGHGDEIVLSDGNFPAKALGNRVIRCDGSDIPELLDAIMQFLPLDYTEAHAVVLMEKPDELPEPPVWDAYRSILSQRSREEFAIGHISRQAFYSRAQNAYVIVATGEKTRFANILLKKGIVRFQG
jgi:L-fucose mutarotase